MDITDKNFDLLEKLIKISTVQHKVIANNIANVNTPGYKALEVSFQKELESALSDNSTTSINSFRPKIMVSRDTGRNTLRNDGNNVNMEDQVSSLVKNSLSYSIYIQMLGKKFAGLKQAIAGRIA